MTPVNRPPDQALALIVDDDPMMRLLIRGTLEQTGFHCEEASDGAEALRAFARLRPDVVLLDLLMPGMDGFEACAAIRAMPLGNRVPILVLTGLEDTSSINRAYEIGATDFLSKPINWGILSHRVRYILRAGRAFQEADSHKASLENAQRIAHLGSWEWDLRNERVEYSAESRRLLGLEEPAARSGIERLLERVHPEDLASAEEALRELRECGDMSARLLRVQVPNGPLRHVRLQGSALPLPPEVATHLSGTLLDVTELREAEQHIRTLAYFDETTQLPNREYFTDMLNRALGEARRHQRQLAVMCLDLDQFKRINTSLGHAAGNELLAAAASRISDALRRGDGIARPGGEVTREGEGAELLARLNGDEFSVLLPEVERYQDAAKVAVRVLRRLHDPFTVSGQEVFISASVGLAIHPTDGDDSETLMRNAGAAMHFAKDQGRDNYQYFSQAMNAAAVEKLSLESQLRHALERGELFLVYQPKVELATNRIIGVEALIRWRHPDLGIVPPNQFIPVAEETGLIIPIGDWVIREASRQNRAWQRAGLPPVHVAVNIASSHFRQGGLLDSVQAALEESGLPGDMLELEVTESMLMQNLDQTLASLGRLKDMGLRLAIDDFGTGYSSLAYLKRFPLDTLKIDRSFIRDLPGERQDRAIVRAVIGLAESLSMSIVAEGVEEAAQLEFLIRQGCYCVQGYIFSRPVGPTEIEALLRSGPLYPQS